MLMNNELMAERASEIAFEVKSVAQFHIGHVTDKVCHLIVKRHMIALRFRVVVYYEL